MLQLVLGNHPDQEVLLLHELREPVEDLLAHPPHVGPRVLRREDRELPALGTLVRERVVQVVEPRRGGPAAVAVPEQPELLEVADVREVPDERRLQRRDLARQLLVVQRLEQGLGSLARVLEDGLELSR